MESTTRLLLPEVQEALETNPEGLSGLISELPLTWRTLFPS